MLASLGGRTDQVPPTFCRPTRPSQAPVQVSLAATPKRASANIVARTLTWGSAPRPTCPHVGHLKTGLEVCRVKRMRPSNSSSSSRRPSRASMDRSSRQYRRRCSTISGNQTRCTSPAATAHHLRLVRGTPLGWRPSPDRRVPGVIPLARPPRPYNRVTVGPYSRHASRRLRSHRADRRRRDGPGVSRDGHEAEASGRDQNPAAPRRR